MTIPENERRTDTAVALALLLAGAAYFASFQPWTRPVLLDAATWDYMAVETARGLVPYRDVFLHKTPGAALLGAVGAKAGEALGLEPVLVAHALFLLLGALGPALLYLLCRPSLTRAAAVAAAVGMMACDEWPIAALEGCRPKVATVAFGLASMLAAQRGRAMLASLLGGCSVLFWQPGLAFLLGAWATVLARGGSAAGASGYEGRGGGAAGWRPGRLVAMGAVSLVPSALLLGWFAAHGALGDFFEQAVFFNVDYIERKARPALGTVRALARTARDWNDVELLLAPAALAGLALLRAARRRGATDSLPLALVVSGAIYLGMTFASYQSWPDAILLTPLAGAAIGAGLHSLLRSRLAAAPAALLAVLVVALAAVPDSRPKFHPPVDFATQRARFAALAGELAPTDEVIGVSVPEFFLHTGRRNGWKWPYLWFGVDEFAAAHHAGGFDGILADLDRRRPAMILVARMWSGPTRDLFEAWAATRYRATKTRLWPHLRKPLMVYRLRGAAAAGQEGSRPTQGASRGGADRRGAAGPRASAQ